MHILQLLMNVTLPSWVNKHISPYLPDDRETEVGRTDECATQPATPNPSQQSRIGVGI